jgi:hypothetical protein
MSFQLSTASPSDAPAFANIYTSSFHDSPISLRMFPRSQEFQKWWTESNLSEISRPNGTHFLKVTDTDSGTIVGYATWSGPMEDTTEQGADYSEAAWPIDAERKLCENFFGQLAKKRQAWMGKRRHWCMFLLYYNNLISGF